MNEEELYREISLLIEKKEYPEAERKLDELFLYKPVLFSWYALKAELMLAQNEKISEIRRSIYEKVFLGCSYEGVEKYYDIMHMLAAKEKDIVEMKRLAYEKELYTESEDKSTICKMKALEEQLLAEAVQTFSEEVLAQLCDVCYCQSDMISYVILSYYLKNICGKTECQIRPLVAEIPNFGFLTEQLESQIFPVLMIKGNNHLKYDLLIEIMKRCGSQIYVIMEDASVEDYGYYQKDKVAYWTYPTSANLPLSQKITYCMKDMRAKSGDITWLTIAESDVLDVLMQDMGMRKMMERLTPGPLEKHKSDLAYGWFGKYTDCMSVIYNMDVDIMLERPSEVRYSIVIPTRNSINSLADTLKTCLNLDYQNYEILLSDNSTNNNADVYNLYCTLKDDRIRYIRTPRDLHLCKSFEYAILQARGEFVITLGSDDGILPWALKVLDEVRGQFPEEDIIQWERGFYAWPGFNGAQENQFVMPRKYQKGNYQTYFKHRIDYLAEILNDSAHMYSLPMLYINSGFKRSYMQKVLKRTGALLDGICQDIYMGIVNVAINDRILNLRYPLTIAGMSSGSAGAQSILGNRDIKSVDVFGDEDRKTSNIGGVIYSYTERLLVYIYSDVSCMYQSLLRVIDKGLLPLEYLNELFDWKKIILNLVNRIDIKDLKCEWKLYGLKYAVSFHDDELQKWYEEKIMPVLKKRRKMLEDPNNKKEKSYAEGMTQEGGVILDASRYGVSNIAQAVELFEKLF